MVPSYMKIKPVEPRDIPPKSWDAPPVIIVLNNLYSTSSTTSAASAASGDHELTIADYEREQQQKKVVAVLNTLLEHLDKELSQSQQPEPKPKAAPTNTNTKKPDITMYKSLLTFEPKLPTPNGKPRGTLA
jgi:hypothetical protein